SKALRKRRNVADTSTVDILVSFSASNRTNTIIARLQMSHSLITVSARVTVGPHSTYRTARIPAPKLRYCGVQFAGKFVSYKILKIRSLLRAIRYCAVQYCKDQLYLPL